MRVPPSGRGPAAVVPFASPVRFDRSSGVPGLGFDFPHLAAISGGLANNPAPRFGHAGHHRHDSFSSILFWGNPFYFDDMSYDQAEQPQAPEEPPAPPQPQIIVIQQPAPAAQGANTAAGEAGPSAAPSSVPEESPVPDRGNFILIRRDGHILFASVFSVVGSQLQYVTPEGIRRTMDLTDLDAEASQQMNEARGTTVQFHN